jgi:hypothetical protein
MTRLILSVTAALPLLSGAASPAFAAPCKDAKGRFVKCPEAKKAPVRCKDAKGKFAKCGAPGAKPM